MYLITNRALCKEKSFIDVLSEAGKCKVKNIIIREKDLNDDELIKLYMDIKYNFKCKKIKSNLIINSNIYVFKSVNGDGVHLPFKLFKQLLSNKYQFDNKKIIGISTHSIDEIKYIEKIRKYKKIKIDYITLSHIYETDCKKNLRPKGLEILKEAKKITNIKIIALGGITPKNINETLKYCDDVAVMSQIMKSNNVTSMINLYLRND